MDCNNQRLFWTSLVLLILSHHRNFWTDLAWSWLTTRVLTRAIAERNFIYTLIWSILSIVKRFLHLITVPTPLTSIFETKSPHIIIPATHCSNCMVKMAILTCLLESCVKGQGMFQNISFAFTKYATITCLCFHFVAKPSFACSNTDLHWSRKDPVKRTRSYLKK